MKKESLSKASLSADHLTQSAEYQRESSGEVARAILFRALGLYGFSMPRRANASQGQNVRGEAGAN
jgi:hypothetical protein